MCFDKDNQNGELTMETQGATVALDKTTIVSDEIALQQLIEQGGLLSYFQSIQDIQNQGVAGYEALVRGPLDTRLHRADQLFATADKYNLTHELEIASLSSHLNTIAGINGQAFFTVNISPKMLFDARVWQILNDFSSPSRIKLELTEHLPVDDWQPVKQKMNQLRTLGYQIWLDDVGCGFFDLELIDTVQPEVVKLCIKIVSRLTIDSHLVQDIKSVIQAVHQYGGKVLAEGIEEQQQLDMAKQLGVDYAQGFLFDKPAPLC